MKIYALIGYDTNVKQDCIIAVYFWEQDLTMPLVTLKKEVFDKMVQVFYQGKDIAKWENVREMTFESLSS